MATKSRVRVIRDHNVAANPIAKAVALAKLNKSLRTCKLALYTMEDGEDCHALLKDLLRLLATVAKSAELQWGESPDDVAINVAIRVTKGACSSCCQVLGAGRGWDQTQAVPIERGLEEAEMLNKSIKPVHMWDAIEIFRDQWPT